MYCKYCGKPLTGSVCEFCGKDNQLEKKSGELDDLLRRISPAFSTDEYRRGYENGMKAAASNTGISAGMNHSEAYRTGMNEGYQKGLNEGYLNGVTDASRRKNDRKEKQRFIKRTVIFCLICFLFGSLISGIIANKTGYNSGLQKGNEQGLSVGESKGREEGLKEGYESGKADGHNDGFEAGREQGFTEGYKKGRNDSLQQVNPTLESIREDFFNRGKQEGLRQCSSPTPVSTVSHSEDTENNPEEIKKPIPTQDQNEIIITPSVTPSL